MREPAPETRLAGLDVPSLRPGPPVCVPAVVAAIEGVGLPGGERSPTGLTGAGVASWHSVFGFGHPSPRSIHAARRRT